MDWLFGGLQAVFTWIQSIVKSLVDLLKALPSLVGLVSNWNIFVPSFVLAFFSISIALGIILFILNRK